MRLGQVLLACALCLVGVVFFTSLKTSFLYLLALKQQSDGKQWYAALFFVLLVPEIVTFLRIMWSTSFAVKGRLARWPPCKIIFIGMFTTVLESAALAFFTLEVSPQLPGYLVLPLMNVLLFLQVLLEQWKRSTARNFLPNHNVPSPSFVSRVLHSVAAIFGISIFILSACLLIVLDITEMPRVVALIAAVLALSVVWSQPIKVYIFQAECSSETVRYNISLLLSFVRIVSLGIFSMAVIPMGGIVEIYDSPKFLWDGITSLGESRVLMSVLAVNCCAGLLTYALTRISAYYTTTWSGILIPSILSTTIASVIYILNCFDGIYLTLSVDVCPMSEESLIVAGFVILLWLLPMLIMRRNYFIPADTFFKPELENFITFGYSAVFFDQHSLLNYYPCPLMFRETGLNGNGRSRVFMCTTMYREADYEMEQLLKSLAKISKSQRLKKKKIYLEAHIFLDNGAEGLTLKEFALQLMALVQNCLAVGRSDGNIHKTPYGLQISCVLPGGMPMFVHLKDPTFVKAKKRWSQVMYMNYIMDYRIKMTTQITDIQHQMKLKREVGPTKYTQMIMQIRSLLENLKDQDEEQEKRSIHSKCGSAYSSDQGIETGDDMSETSSQRYQMKATEYSNGRSTSPPSTSNSYANLVSAEYPLGKTTPMYISETSSQTGSHSSGDDGRPSTVFPSSASYTSFISTDFSVSKVNPAYIPDENELLPPKWLPEFTSDSTLTSHAPSLSDIRGSARDLNMLEFASDEKIATISEDTTALDLSQLTPTYDDRTYILATDADMQFNDLSVLDLVETCNSDLRLGAACGRTHPMGKKKHPIVWFQMFEYAKDFWLIKSAQNIIGSVMCCPGCFSLYRVKALEGVLHLYSEPTYKPGDVFTKDTGEDRWMCTLMMLRGWKLQYSNFAYNGTYCPDTVEEFIKQRRRWILSDFANSLMVFRNLPQLIRSNGCFSIIYAIYLLQLFFIVFLSPGSTVIMLTVGLDMLVGLNFYILTPIVSFILILYGYLCTRLSSNMQILLTKFSIVVLGTCMSAVVLGAAYFVIRDLVKDIQEDTLQLQEHYILITLTGSLLYAAMLHPKECWLLFNGLFYLFFFPAMHMLLPVYALCNIVDQTWGTRDNQKAKLPKLLCFPKMKFKRRRKKKKNKDQKSADAEEVDPEDNEISLEQLKPMRSEEQLFWNQLVEKLIGKDINLGLEKDVLSDGLKSLRLRTLIAILVANVTWVIGLGLFYASSVDTTDALSGYGIMNGILYGFSFVIQVVGMTVYRFSDCAHRLGKKVFKDEKSHWVTRREHRMKEQL